VCEYVRVCVCLCVFMFVCVTMCVRVCVRVVTDRFTKQSSEGNIACAFAGAVGLGGRWLQLVGGGSWCVGRGRGWCGGFKCKWCCFFLFTSFMVLRKFVIHPGRSLLAEMKLSRAKVARRSTIRGGERAC
jgi:hypothetical protein